MYDSEGTEIDGGSELELTVAMPNKLNRLINGEATVISGDEFTTSERIKERPKNWKSDKKARNKAARKSRRINRK